MNGLVRSEVASRLEIQRGDLFYTSCGGRWQDRKWQAATAAVTDSMVSAALPEGVAACFLAIQDERGAYVSSPCMQIGDAKQ